MQENFNELISKIKTDLPDLITPEMLVGLGLGNHTMLFRLRQSSDLPFIKLSNARILYLKTDVIDWLQKRYHNDIGVKKEEQACSLK